MHKDNQNLTDTQWERIYNAIENLLDLANDPEQEYQNAIIVVANDLVPLIGKRVSMSPRNYWEFTE